MHYAPLVFLLLTSCGSDGFAQDEPSVLKMVEPTETEKESVERVQEDVEQIHVDVDILLERLDEVHPRESKSAKSRRNKSVRRAR